MIQTDSINNCARDSGILSSAKTPATAVILSLVLLSSACHYHGGPVPLASAPQDNVTSQPVATTLITNRATTRVTNRATTSSQAVQQQNGRRSEVAANALGAQELVAADLINAMMQIEKLHPSRVTLDMGKQSNDFSNTVKFVLEQAGYNFSSFQTGTQKANVKVVVKLRDLERKGNGLYRRYQINFGEAKFRREYFIQPQGVTPSSDLMVKGVDASRIVLNEDIFEGGTGPAIQPAAIVAQNGNHDSLVASSGPAVPKASPATVTNSTNLPALATATAISPQRDHDHDHDHGNEQHADSRFHDNFKVKQNRFALGHSNFANQTQNFINVKSQVLVFANDSLNLGRRNKATVREFAKPFIAESDVISIVGCSHGRTSITNGNAVLATGRTQRVKEAFLIAGIAEDRILDEGCWSATGDISKTHPRRGVTVTLKRERRNG